MGTQGGFIMQKIRVAVIGVGEGSGKTFVANGLWYFLRNKNRFINKEEKYEIADNPEHPEDYDLIVGVIDPLPSRVKANIDIYSKFNEPAWDTIWIINKLNEGVNLKELEWFLKRKFNFKQKLINPSYFYRSEYLKSDFYLTNEDDLDGIQNLASEIERKSIYFLY